MGLDGRLGIIWSSYFPDGTSAWPCPPVAQAVSDLNWEKLYWKCCAMQYPFDTRTSCNARVDCASRRPRPREWPFRTLSPRAFSSPPPCLSSPDRKKPRVCRPSSPSHHSSSLRARRFIQFLAEVLKETDTSTWHLQSGLLAGNFE